MKNLKINDEINLSNAGETKTFKVIARNDEAQDPPEYDLEDLESGEIHSPVFWRWLEDQ
jgi:hypothetical protein